MKVVPQPDDFAAWRSQSRLLLAERIPPTAVLWDDPGQLSLFEPRPAISLKEEGASQKAGGGACSHVPREFYRAAQFAACHRDSRRWDLLYQALWRVVQGERELLRMKADPLACRVLTMVRQVKGDAHRMKGFVRFQCLKSGDVEHWVSWYRPDHYVLELAAPYFVQRFGSRGWTILTPDRSVCWDGTSLAFGPGVDAPGGSAGDGIEELWRVFYQALYCPERKNLKVMKSHMPQKLWGALPELKGLVSE